MADIKKKHWYLVNFEGIAPVSYTLRVLAEDEEDAARIAEMDPSRAYLETQPRVDIKRMKKHKVSVKDTLTGLINMIRNF